MRAQHSYVSRVCRYIASVCCTERLRFHTFTGLHSPPNARAALQPRKSYTHAVGRSGTISSPAGARPEGKFVLSYMPETATS